MFAVAKVRPSPHLRLFGGSGSRPAAACGRRFTKLARLCDNSSLSRWVGSVQRAEGASPPLGGECAGLRSTPVRLENRRASSQPAQPAFTEGGVSPQAQKEPTI